MRPTPLLVLPACLLTSCLALDAGQGVLDLSSSDAARADGRDDDAGRDAGDGDGDPADAAPIDGDAGVCPPDDPAITSQPSTRSLRVRVLNDTAEPQFLVTRGWFCDAFAVQGSSGGVPLQVGFQCLCECPNPGSARPSEMVELAPGAEHVLTWDARGLRTYRHQVDCSVNWPGADCTVETMGALQPVADGDYQIRVAVQAALPTTCWDTGDGVYSCEPGYDGTYPYLPPNPQQLCPSARVAQTSVHLEGNAAIDASILLSSAVER